MLLFTVTNYHLGRQQSNIIHISAACRECRSHFSFPFIVPLTGLLLLLDDAEDATGRIVPPCISLEIKSGACAMAFWHSKWAIKSLICNSRTADQLAANHKLYHTFCIADHWLKWQKTKHEYHTFWDHNWNILTSSCSFSIFSSFDLRAACSLK